METNNNAVAPATAGAVQTASAEQKPNSGLVKAKSVIPECRVLKRLEDKSEESVLSTIRNMTGDPDFAQKFITYTKIQVRNSWRKDASGKWYNLFDKVPLDSVLECLYKAARRGVLPDGYNAYLVVYTGKDPHCQLLIDYKGLCDCALADGVCSDIGATEVCENDILEISWGEVSRFEIDPKKPRGSVIGCVAWAILPNGRRKSVFVDLKTLEDIRACAQTDKIWRVWTVEMYKKTAIRRLFKTMRNTPRMRSLMEADNEDYDLDRDERSTERHGKPRVKSLAGAAPVLPSPDSGEGEPDGGMAEAVEAEAEPVFA